MKYYDFKFIKTKTHRPLESDEIEIFKKKWCYQSVIFFQRWYDDD